MIPKTFLVIFIFSIFYALLELLKRRSGIKREYTRKIAHIASAILIISLYFFINKMEFIIITSIFTIFFAISYSKKFLDSIHMQNYTTFGEIFYPFSLVLLGTFYFDKPFIIISAIAIMGFADGISGIYNLQYKKRSFSGSLIFFLISNIVLLLTYTILIKSPAPLATFKIVFVSIIISIIEYVSHIGTDNLTVPISSAILLSLMF